MSEPLYPPILKPERFSTRGYGNEIVSICRIEPHKRQHLMIEAMNFVKSDVHLRLCGSASNANYLQESLSKLPPRIRKRITVEEGWITEARKVQLLADCLAVAYAPLDEDSYGYPSLEAAHSRKAVITTTDSGGVLELINDLQNGIVCEPSPYSLAEAMDRLFLDKILARKLGMQNYERTLEMKISWSHVVERLTS